MTKFSNSELRSTVEHKARTWKKITMKLKFKYTGHISRIKKKDGAKRRRTGRPGNIKER